MNDDTDKPLNPVGDDALEARITAWVLGEASPFEAAELEALCARSPEARLFERRLRVLHAFITEDRKAGPEDEWKLPAEKRAKVEALFSPSDRVPSSNAEATDRGNVVFLRKTGRRALLAIAACTVISLASWAVFQGTANRVMTDGFARMEKSAAPAASSAMAPDAEMLLPGEMADTRKPMERGVPAKKPDSAYAHLRNQSAFTTQPPPAAMPRESEELFARQSAPQQQAEADPFAAGTPLASVVPPPAPATAVPAKPGEPASVGGGSVGFTQTRANSDVIAPVEGAAIPGIPAADAPTTDIVTGGLRSGDGAITRNSIDAVLNNPDRATVDPNGPAATAIPEFLSRSEVAERQQERKGEQPGGQSGGGASPKSLGLDNGLAAKDQAPSDAPDFGNLAQMGRLAEPQPAEESRFLMRMGGGGKADGDSPANGTTGTAALSELAPRAEDQPVLGESDLQTDAVLGGFRRDLSTETREKAKPLETDFEGFVNQGTPASENLHWDSLDEATKTPAPGAKAPSSAGLTGLAQKETIRRQNAVATSDKLRDEARSAYTDGNYQDAVAKYKESLGVLPDAPMVEDRRRFLNDSLGDAAGALAEQYRKVGKYDEARQLADDMLAADATDVDAKRIKEHLDDPIRTNPALTFEHTENVDEVRRKLYLAEGNYNLGKHDEAHRVYEDVLRIDPYNKAARRGMEQVAQARADYYRAAYDQTRAQLLAEVDKAWELSVPPVTGVPESTAGNALMIDKRRSIVIPEINFVDATVEEALDFLRVKAVELDVAELDPAKKGVNLALAMPSPDSGVANPATLRIKSLQLKNAALGDAIDEIARASGLEVTVNDHAVVLRTGADSPSKGEHIADLMAETATAAEPFSTFSLHVSDASFKLAKAALDRGEVPAAESIRPEEFYNAFDYGDPGPGRGEPVACAVEQSAHPAIPQRNLLRIGVKTGSQGRGGSTPLNLTLLLDSSGSMEREDRTAGLANAVKQLSGLLKEGDTISVIGFSRQPRLLADRLPGARAQELNALIAQTPSEGGTNLEEGLKLGEQLALRQFNPAAQNRIVLFTDGAANLGDAMPETLQAKVEQMRQKGIAFDAAGFGADGLNDQLLERLTRNGNGRYYIVDTAEDADANFARQLAGAFRPAAENVKVQVRFNPARVAKYKLIGFEEHRLKKEDFRNDSVDAAEMAAEEAGNALYQIETLPQGEGEVGEVSVRFRDAASGQMVERTWTIPYDAQAPAFDQAKPSLQLAGLAAFAAEKLRAAPLADAIDFQQLAPVVAKVKARYPNSRPVAELEAMIGRLK